MLLGFPKRAETGLRGWRDVGFSMVYGIKPPSSRLCEGNIYSLMG